MEQLTFDFALCACGCGGVTPPARYTDKRSGLVQGKPTRYIKGHSRRRRVDANGRECGECGEYKPWDDFHVSQTTTYGCVTTCKPCKSLKAAAAPRPHAAPNTVGKLCECGCGEPTSLATRTDPRLGWVKGRAVRFVNGHWRRGKVFTDPEERRERQRAKSRRRYAASRKESIARSRAYRAAGYQRPPGGNLKAKYGITFKQYSAMVAAQCGACAICGAIPGADPDTSKKTSRLVVDHDHETGKVRALLCHACNLMLGQSDDDPDRLRAGADYLAEWSRTQ